MKKSYDYFKTLKDLSEIISESFKNYNDYKNLSKDFLCFSALRNELSVNLINEFVAPIERNDIYKLSFCLNDEFERIIKLCEFVCLSDALAFSFLGQIGNLFLRQTLVFDFKNIIKSPIKALKSVTSLTVECKNLKKIIFAEMRSVISSKNQPLISYVVASSAVELINSIESAVNEVGRVLINNN